MYNLFLDDVRLNPGDLFWGYENTDWTIVKTHDEFVAIIEEKGLPAIVSFDHDLADEHYDHNSIDYNRYKEKTGLTSAQWLIDYIRENNLEQPELRVHSMNPIGRKNIVNLFEREGFYVKMK